MIWCDFLRENIDNGQTKYVCTHPAGPTKLLPKEIVKYCMHNVCQLALPERIKEKTSD